MSWITSKAKSWRRNAQVLFSDVSFRRNLKLLGTIMLVAMAVFAMLWWLGVGIRAEVYRQGGGAHALTFQEYLFSVLGAIDADPDATRGYAFIPMVLALEGLEIIPRGSCGRGD